MSRDSRPLPVLLATIVVLAGWLVLGPLPAAAGSADLAVAVVGTKKHVKFGETFTFTVTVTNLGPDQGTGVALAIGLSDHLDNGHFSCPDGSVSGLCELGTLAPGASVTVPGSARAVCECGVGRLGVVVTSVSHDPDTVDPVPGNDSARTEIKLVGKAPF